MSWYSPKPKQKPIRLPRRRPIKAVPSGIGDEGIVGNWLFYYLKGGDHLHDFSPEKNHGTINGAKWKDGRYGWALDFDGVDDLVKVPNDSSLDISNGFTVACWLYLRETGADAGHLLNWITKASSYEGFTFQLEDTNDLWHFIVGDGSAWSNVSGGTVSKYEWHYTVGTWATDNTQKLYIDGDSVASGSVSAVNSTGPMQIGTGDPDWGDRYIDGIIALVRFYNVAKSGSWISRRFNRMKGIFGL